MRDCSSVLTEGVCVSSGCVLFFQLSAASEFHSLLVLPTVHMPPPASPLHKQALD